MVLGDVADAVLVVAGFVQVAGNPLDDAHGPRRDSLFQQFPGGGFGVLNNVVQVAGDANVVVEIR